MRQKDTDGIAIQGSISDEWQKEFLGSGYELFRAGTWKRSLWRVKWWMGMRLLMELSGRLILFMLGLCFGFWDWGDQGRVGVRCVTLSRHRADALIVVCRVENESLDHDEQAEQDRVGFRHDMRSWGELWNEIGEQTGTVWKPTTIEPGGSDGPSHFAVRMHSEY